jgi:hypothetical protein
MPSGALGLISKVSSKFFHEVMPVVLASVIGTVVVNHYSRQPASQPVIVQAPPSSASADAVFQALRDEHTLITDYLKRDADAKRDGDSIRGPAPPAAPVAPVVEDRSIKIRPASVEKAALRPPPKPAPEKKIAARDPEPPPPDLAIVAPPARAEFIEVTAKVDPGVVGTVRDWIDNVSALPARALALRPFGQPPTPPLPVPGSDLQRIRDP